MTLEKQFISPLFALAITTSTLFGSPAFAEEKGLLHDVCVQQVKDIAGAMYRANNPESIEDSDSTNDMDLVFKVENSTLVTTNALINIRQGKDNGPYVEESRHEVTMDIDSEPDHDWDRFFIRTKHSIEYAADGETVEEESCIVQSADTIETMNEKPGPDMVVMTKEDFEAALETARKDGHKEGTSKMDTIFGRKK